MNVALFHGFPTFHFEMLGYIIEYFKFKNLLDKLTIYANNNIDSINWLLFYNKIFDIKLIWIEPIKFNSHLHTHVILITDDDIYFNNTNSNLKIICIEHQDFIKRYNTYKRLGTRFFPKRQECPCPWAIASFNTIDINRKIEILNDQSYINVILLGQTVPEKIEDLKNIFSNFDNIHFYIIIRKLNYIYNDIDNYKNIFIYENCPTNIMLKLIYNSHYILCFDIKDNEHYISSVCAGSIHLSFSFGCKLIIPNSWNNNFKFKSVITYDKNSKLVLDKNINLQDTYNELNEIIEHRNYVLDNILFNL